MTFTRAGPSCSSAKILHAESEFHCGESPALLRFAWLGWFRSVPTQVAGVFPAKSRMISRPLGQCLLIAWVVHRSSMHPTAWAWLSSPRMGFQKNHNTVAPGTAVRRSKGLLAPWTWTWPRSPRGPRKTLGIQDLNWILKFTFWNCCLLSCWSHTNTSLVPSYQEDSSQEAAPDYLVASPFQTAVGCRPLPRPTPAPPIIISEMWSWELWDEMLRPTLGWEHAHLPGPHQGRARRSAESWPGWAHPRFSCLMRSPNIGS